MAYTSQPFPRMLYLDGANRTVQNAGEERDSKRAGWGDVPSWTTEQAVEALEREAEKVFANLKRLPVEDVKPQMLDIEAPPEPAEPTEPERPAIVAPVHAPSPTRATPKIRGRR